MLTIAFLSHTTGLAGAEKMLLNLACMLKSGHDISPVLLLPGKEGDFVQAAKDKKIRYESINPSPWYHYSKSADLNYWAQVQHASDSIKRVLVNYACDAIIINTLTSISGMLAAIELGIPYILWAHGVIESMLLPERNSNWALANDLTLLECSAKVIVNSDWTGNYFRKILPFSSNLQLIHNWTEIPPENKIPKKDLTQPIFVCLNALEKNKGHLVLIKAIMELKNRGYHPIVNFFGNGPDLNLYKQFIRKEKLQDYIKIYPRTTHPELAIDQATCLVTPSYIESFSLVMIEAMARKTLVISTSSGGPQEVITDGKNGFLVPPGDDIALANTMERIIRHPELIDGIVETAYKDINSRFSPEFAKLQFEETFIQVVNDFKGYNNQSTLLYTLIRSFEAEKLEELSISDLKDENQNNRGQVNLNIFSKNEKCAMPVQVKTGALRFGGKLMYRGIVPRRNLWTGFGIMLGTHHQTPTGFLRLTIYSLQGNKIRESVLDLTNARDNDWFDITFDPIYNSKEVEFKISLEWIKRNPSSRLSVYFTGPMPGMIVKGILFGLSWLKLPPIYRNLYYRTWYS